MAINEKLNHIKETKELIRQALINKGVEVTEEDSFRSYANKIADIPQEGGDPYYEDLYNLRTSNGTNMAGLFARTTGDKLDLTVLDTSKCTDMQYMFSYCKFKNIDCSGWDISKVTNVQYMFENCSSNINTTGWDTSRLTSMNYLFSNFNGSIDISNWDTSNVTSSQYMFTYAKLSNVRGIETLKLPKVTSYEYLFNGAERDTLDLSSWDTSNVTNMSRLFYLTKIRRLDLSNWNTSKVTNMQYTFQFSYGSITEELIIPDWDMTKTTSYSNLFGNSSYTTKLRYIDLSRSNDLTISRITSFLPKRTITTYGDVVIPADSSQDVIDAIIAKYWRPIGPKFELQSFQISSELDEILLNKKTKVVCHTPSPWYAELNKEEVEFISSDESIASINDNGEVNAISLGNVEIYARLKNNPEIVSNTITINVSEVDSTPYVIKFKGTKTPSTNHYVKINGSNVKLSSMNYDANTGVYTYDVGKEITSIQFNGRGTEDYKNTMKELLKFDFNGNNITSMKNMFLYCGELTTLDVSNWDTGKVTNMVNLFKNCESLTTLDVSKWDTSNVTDMSGMFNICRTLTALDVSKWDTSNVTDMNYIFSGCNSITSIDVSNWNMSNVGNMSFMFFGMPITSLDLSNWNVEKAHSMNSTFRNCTNLEYLELSSWVISNTTGVLNMFTNVPSTCSIYVDNDTWAPDESATGFSGTFIRV